MCVPARLHHQSLYRVVQQPNILLEIRALNIQVFY